MTTRSSSKTTTTRKTTTRKAAKAPAKKTAAKAPSLTAAAKAAAGKTAPQTTPATVSKLEPVVSGPALRKKELLDAVTAKTGMKRADVKKVVEATLDIMGLALQDSRDVHLQPFGTVKINRERKLPDGRVVVARIRQARDLPADATEETAETGAPDGSKTAAE